jgi:glycosyltransferase involved in cell wall biosynthesis
MGIPCVITAHHGGIVCPNGTLMNQADAICEKPVSAKNCLDCCLHNVPGGKFWSPIINQLPQEYAGRIASFLRSRRNIPFVTPAFTTSLAIANKIKIIAAMGHGADAFIAPSAAIAKTLERNGIESKKIFVIPHGIPLAAQQPFQPGLGSRPVRFIYVGRISHIKGLHVMLTALSQLNPADYELHVVGGAVTKPEKRYLAKLHRAFPQVKTTWHGVCDPNKVQELVTYCDVMIHPAICLEIFGLTIAEAMALGRPVLATRCGGAEAQIKDGVDGWLVPPNDIRALSNAIRKLIQNPESVVETAANIGQVVSITTHVEALEALYKTVLSHSKARNPS